MDYSAAHFLVTKYTPMKIRKLPATTNRLNSSPKIIANKAVIRGSVNKKELATAAPACFIT